MNRLVKESKDLLFQSNATIMIGENQCDVMAFTKPHFAAEYYGKDSHWLVVPNYYAHIWLGVNVKDIDMFPKVNIDENDWNKVDIITMHYHKSEQYIIKNSYFHYEIQSEHSDLIFVSMVFDWVDYD